MRACAGLPPTYECHIASVPPSTPLPPPAQAVNWLRRQWSEGNNAALADEAGLGRSACVLAFLHSLRADFGCAGPALLVVPAASLPFWEGEPRAARAARTAPPPAPVAALACRLACLLGARGTPGLPARCTWHTWAHKHALACPLTPPTPPPPPALPGEFSFWLGDGVDVLPYYGTVAARAAMHDHELWLHPSSLEGRGLPRTTLADRVRRCCRRGGRRPLAGAGGCARPRLMPACWGPLLCLLPGRQ
jgi:hypothetical protein